MCSLWKCKDTSGTLGQVRVSRRKVLESAKKVMEMYAKSRALLELEFFDEAGTGLGPTLEFYTLLAHELQKRGLGMWRNDDGGAVDGRKTGRFCAPLLCTNVNILYVPLMFIIRLVMFLVLILRQLGGGILIQLMHRDQALCGYCPGVYEGRRKHESSMGVAWFSITC